MYAAQVTGALLMGLFWLAVVQTSHVIAGNERPPVFNSTALQQATGLEKKARQLLYAEGDYDQALTVYQEALELKTRTLGPDDIGLAPILMDIALCYRAISDYPKAEQAYQRAVNLRERALGQVHIEVGRTLKHYACLMRLAGRSDEADNLNTRAASILYGLRKSKSGPVTGTVVNGTRLSLPQPKYPKYARKQRVAGSVTVSIVIAENGTVIEGCAIEGPPALALASETAASRALFTPTTLDGVPVKVSGMISYNFVAR